MSVEIAKQNRRFKPSDDSPNTNGIDPRFFDLTIAVAYGGENTNILGDPKRIPRPTDIEGDQVPTTLEDTDKILGGSVTNFVLSRTWRGGAFKWTNYSSRESTGSAELGEQLDAAGYKVEITTDPKVRPDLITVDDLDIVPPYSLGPKLNGLYEWLKPGGVIAVVHSPDQNINTNVLPVGAQVKVIEGNDGQQLSIKIQKPDEPELKVKQPKTPFKQTGMTAAEKEALNISLDLDGSRKVATTDLRDVKGSELLRQVLPDNGFVDREARTGTFNALHRAIIALPPEERLDEENGIIPIAEQIKKVVDAASTGSKSDGSNSQFKPTNIPAARGIARGYRNIVGRHGQGPSVRFPEEEKEEVPETALDYVIEGLKSGKLDVTDAAVREEVAPLIPPVRTGEDIYFSPQLKASLKVNN